MAVSMRANVAAGRVARATPSRRMVMCQAAQGETFGKAQIAAAALAAAALISAAPVQAGVVLQQPELKKVFQATGTPEPVKERPFRQPGAAPATAAKAEDKAKAPKVEEPLSDGGLDPRSIALPASLAVIGGLGFAFSKVDNGFSEWITDSGALVRKSDNWAGFEEDLKGDNYRWAQDYSPAGTKKVGTKVTKKGGKK